MNSLVVINWVEHLYVLLVLIFVITVLTSGKKPGSVMAWIFAIVFIPVLGMLLYVALGVNWRKRRLLKIKLENNPNKILAKISTDISKKEIARYDTKDIFETTELRLKNLDDLTKGLEEHGGKEIARLLHTTGGTYLTKNSSCDFYFEGEKAFESIINDLENAKESIYMEYFIWKSDELGEKIKDILLRKAAEGLDIKLIFDGLGSFGRISVKYRKSLEAAGIEFRYFLDVKYKLMKLNYRNHRKMVIVDSKVLHTGGMNLGQEYIDGGKAFDSWRDTNARIEGEIVLHYLAVFISDWMSSNGKFDFVLPKEKTVSDGEYIMQLSASGPDTIWTSLQMLYTKLITEATKEILIESPYFVPDDGILEQLKIAALSGVSVKIIITGKPDKKVPYWVAETYFEELLNSGIEVYRYQKGFLHCKNVVIDGKLSTMGTCNFDFRSFELNYEINTVYYNKELSLRLREQFFEDLKYCTKITNEELDKKNLLFRLRDSIFRILSPIL